MNGLTEYNVMVDGLSVRKVRCWPTKSCRDLLRKELSEELGIPTHYMKLRPVAIMPRRKANDTNPKV